MAVSDPLRDHRPADGLSDGREYVAIISGIGGWIGGMVAHNLDPRDPTAAKGWGNMTAELKKVTTKGAGNLFVFALPKSTHPSS